MTPHTTTVTASARDAAEPREQANRGERLEFAEAVRFYLQLSPKQLPSRFLYDTLGSHGCVHILPKVAKKMWNRVDVGTTVQVFGRKPGT